MFDEFDRRVARQLGRRIRGRRTFLGLSQAALAERAGVHRTQISLYEHGLRMPLASSLIRLAGALGVSVGQLAAGIEWEAPPLPSRALGGDDPWDPGEG
jgi:transcriptional regulator with XRE-family HTH domain